MMSEIRLLNYAFIYYEDGFLDLKLIIDNASKRLESQSLLERLLILSHYQIIEDNQGGRKMYDTVRRSLYLPVMENHVHFSVSDCASCLNRRDHPKRRTLFTSLCSTVSLEINLCGNIWTSYEDETRIAVHCLHREPLHQVISSRPDDKYYHPILIIRITQLFFSSVRSPNVVIKK